VSLQADLLGKIKTDIIANFQGFCDDNNWTHEIAAQKIGCSRSHISKIFAGTRNPSIEILRRMEEVMNNGK